MQNCPMCGSEIQEGEYKCRNCGGEYSPEFFSDPDYFNKIIVNNPIWTEVSVDLSSFTGDGRDFIERLRSFWNSSEANPVTRLALFPGQFQDIAPDVINVTLYAPEDFYFLTERFFSDDKANGLSLHYKRLPLDEIMKQQKIHAKFK